MHRLLVRLPLAACLIAGTFIVVLAGLGVVVWRADSLMRDFALERFQQQLHDDSLTLRDRIQELGPIHMEDGKLYAGNAGAAEFQDLLDRVFKSIHRTGAVFLRGTRVASSLVKPDGTHPIGEAINDPQILEPVLRQGRETFSYSAVSGVNVVSYLPLRDRSGTVIGMVSTGSPMAFVDAMSRRLLWQLLLCAGAAILLGLGLILAMVTVSLRPLRRQAAALRALAEGQADRDVPGQDRTDSLGEIARAVVIVQQAVVRTAALESEAAASRLSAEADKRAALLKMADTIEHETLVTLASVGRDTGTLAETATAMREAAAGTGASAQAAALAAGEALTNAQAVANAAEQLAGSIREIGGQVQQSSAIVARAVQAGSETRGIIGELNDKVGRIGVVADMIGEIAAKTNLLALNATIEAARAGDAGKGFAVVASEVKALATQTARSTQEIAQHISEVRTATGASVTAVGHIEQTIGEINAIASAVAAAVEQQGAATADIARNVTVTANAANEMTRRTTEVSTEAAKTGEHAGAVEGFAECLQQAIDDLTAAVTRVVRTATPEVDRREAPRVAIGTPCRVSLAGQPPFAARLIDLSQGGAAIGDAAMLTIGARGTLDPERLGMPVPFVVRANRDGVAHVRFELDQAAAAKLATLLRQFDSRQAA